MKSQFVLPPRSTERPSSARIVIPVDASASEAAVSVTLDTEVTRRENGAPGVEERRRSGVPAGAPMRKSATRRNALDWTVIVLPGTVSTRYWAVVFVRKVRLETAWLTPRTGRRRGRSRSG
ncbi:MAG: hypothetical protein M0D55_04925 [Elusimicrobiota bacterium]|nr:MAG: hypothetical protein M0D55_04925 [Elusimicrobiota bacterium]